MNKTDLINKLAERLDGDKKAAQTAVEGFIDLVQREVPRGRSVSISGFGVFEKRARAARTARNPRTGEAVKVKKTTVPAFRPGKYSRSHRRNGETAQGRLASRPRRGPPPPRPAEARLPSRTGRRGSEAGRPDAAAAAKAAPAAAAPKPAAGRRGRQLPR